MKPETRIKKLLKAAKLAEQAMRTFKAEDNAYSRAARNDALSASAMLDRVAHQVAVENNLCLDGFYDE